MALHTFESSAGKFKTPNTDKTGHKDAIAKMIQEYANSRPRQVQKTLGPSSVGVACDRYLVGLMSSGAQTGHVAADDNPWYSIVGTATHGWLSEMLHSMPGWMVEERVEIGSPSVPYGHCDGFHPESGLVLDWKILGKTSLDSIRVNGPSRVYREQLQVYGLGWERMGYKPTEVLLVGLPRTPSAVLPFLHEAQLWAEPYDRQFAEASVARVDRLQQEALRLRAAKAKNLLSVSVTPGKDCKWCPFQKTCPDFKA